MPGLAVSRVFSSPARPPEAFPTLVSGLHTRPAIISHDGDQHGYSSN
ncbi:MAG TPA: hypothetical protein VIL00_02695 [Pseudonocardiaceae bacterium]